MTPKEKAKELVDKFEPYSDEAYGAASAKQCAIIAVDEIIESYQLNISLGWTGAIHENNIEYYQKVKEEINKL